MATIDKKTKDELVNELMKTRIGGGPGSSVADIFSALGRKGSSALGPVNLWSALTAGSAPFFDDEVFTGIPTSDWRFDGTYAATASTAAAAASAVSADSVLTMEKLMKTKEVFLKELSKSPRSSARESYEQCRQNTINYLRTNHPEVLGRFKDPWSKAASYEILIEVLNIVNFDREKFGYSRHRAYQAHLEREVGCWMPEDHDKLLDHIRAGNVPAPSPEFKHERDDGTFFHSQREREEAMKGLKAFVPTPKHDPVDELPADLVEALQRDIPQNALAKVW